MTRIGKLDYPKREIRMYASTPVEEAYRLNACAKEPWTVEWIESMPPGSVLYDVGANVGSYTLIAAALGHTVVAIEPSFANYARLCENILLNDLGPKVIPLCMAAGHIWGAPLIEQEATPGYSGGAKRLNTLTAPLSSLAALMRLPAPTHVKIDVDGAELSVLDGMDYDTFKVPSLLVEVSQHEPEIEKWLYRGNYTLKARYDQRDGLPIVGMWMGLWTRA